MYLLFKRNKISPPHKIINYAPPILDLFLSLSKKGGKLVVCEIFVDFVVFDAFVVDVWFAFDL